MKKINLLLLSLLCLVIVGGLAVLMDLVTEENHIVRIGYIGPMSGEAASYGVNIKRGIELAINDYHGILEIELLIEDTGCDPEKVTAAVERLDMAGVLGIIGEVCSEASLIAAAQAEQRGIPMISPASTSPQLSGINKWFFRTIPSDELQGVFLAEQMAAAEINSVVILHSSGAYGEGLADVFSKAYAQNGRELFDTLAFDREKTRFSDEVTRIEKLDPEAILLISNSLPSAIEILNEIRQRGLKIAMWGSEGLFGDQILHETGDSSEGLFVSAPNFGSEEFVSIYSAMYGIQPDVFAAQGYDATVAILAAVLESDEKSRTAVRDALNTISFTGASGVIAFDPLGNVDGNYELYVARSGRFVPYQKN